MHGSNGSTTNQIIKKDKNFKIISLTENRKINKKISGIKVKLNSKNVFKKVDTIIDFTVPKCTLEVLKIASKLKKRVVIGTTGFSGQKKN